MASQPISVCVVFSCVQTMVCYGWLPLLRIVNVRTDVVRTDINAHEGSPTKLSTPRLYKLKINLHIKPQK